MIFLYSFFSAFKGSATKGIVTVSDEELYFNSQEHSFDSGKFPVESSKSVINENFLPQLTFKASEMTKNKFDAYLTRANSTKTNALSYLITFLINDNKDKISKK